MNRGINLDFIDELSILFVPREPFDWLNIMCPERFFMNKPIHLCCVLVILCLSISQSRADSRGDELAKWINDRGVRVWGEPPEQCDDHTFARRIYLDTVGRVPSVSELRDFEELGPSRRNLLIEQLVYSEGERADIYRRLSARQFARHWAQVLIPPGTTTVGSTDSLQTFLAEQYRSGVSYDELISEFIRVPATGNYYQLVGSLPENYAGHLSRVALGVRIECAMCHDHPFSDWKQTDFWGLAAFYGPFGGSQITNEGTTYPVKLLLDDMPLSGEPSSFRVKLAGWLASEENDYFAATGANRFWQQLVGRGLYADVENLDQASNEERLFVDQLGQRFADVEFDMQTLTSAICKSNWYQAKASSRDTETDTGQFVRSLKAVSPDQVFDSLEQALLLPVSRLASDSPRWTGGREQLVVRLSETIGSNPEDFASGIPQALMMMNGQLTNDAIDPERSRLLRAVMDAPFLPDADRLETLYLAVLTRKPTAAETTALRKYLDAQATDSVDRRKAYGEILWALLNSPEFVLCR